jgi:hypothetical protein
MRQQHLKPSGELTANLGIDGHTTSSDGASQKNKLFLYSSDRGSSAAGACRLSRSRPAQPGTSWIA